jgi:flagellar biosynthesis protein FlhA
MENTETIGPGGRIFLSMGRPDIIMGFSVVLILLVMVLPLPPIFLDLLLSLNITMSLVILLMGMYILKPLEFSSFPSVLLVVTLFRLSLNVSSTRLILLRGSEGPTAAGNVINAFGNFVVGGNYVVGIIVFLILVVINFMVITKGAGRIAEVAARFTLDAMPGKQMSIDADLNAGIIDEQEAKERRQQIAREAEYYGAMDGANKFVRGDAVAGILITGINILAGLAIGLFQNGMPIADALHTYTLLTVGDGLVSQIPALIVSTAAGLIVSRAGSESSLGKSISNQFSSQHRAIAVAGAILFGFALIPGLPTLPFLVLGGGASFIAYTLRKESGRKEAEALEVKTAEPAVSADPLGLLQPVDILSMEVGYGLIPLVDASQNGELLTRIKAIRQQIAQEIGILVPAVHIQDNIQLKPAGYVLHLKGNEVARGELMLDKYLAMKPEGQGTDIEGIATQEPTYGLPALWISEKQRERAISEGYTVVDLATVLTTHLSEVIRTHAHEFIGRQEVQELLDNVKRTHPKVVDELVPTLLPLGGVVRVLKNLLAEQIPVRDLLTILERLADWAPRIKDLDMLSEYVRQGLARTITQSYMSSDGTLYALTLGQRAETRMSEGIHRSDRESYLALDPAVARRIMDSLAAEMHSFAGLNQRPVVICSAQGRSHFKKLADRFVPNLVVLSYNEILPETKIQSVGVVELSDAN